MKILETLSSDEIDFESASVVDQAGKVFRWDGGVYRAVTEEYARFYRDLLARPDLGELFDRGLVPAEAAPLSVPGYGLVLKHQTIPFTSYCMEWSAAMFKDAALLYCDLLLALFERGLTLKDAHPWNILFDGGRPFFVDWGSITALQKTPHWPYAQFENLVLLPLLMLSAGKSHIARTFMLDPAHALTRGDVFRLLLGRIPHRDWLFYQRSLRRFSRSGGKLNLAFLTSLRRFVVSIPVSAAALTEWTEYAGQDSLHTTQPSQDWPLKIRNVYDLLCRLQPRTVLDIGSNRGFFSELAAGQGAHVIAADVDEPSINTLYGRVRESGLSILPLVIDISAPTPAHGLMRTTYSAMPDRLSAEMVLALALTHHLVFKGQLRFEAIARQLAAFTRRWLLVEFIPPDDAYVRDWVTEAHRGWYRLDEFKKALEPHFARIQVCASSPTPRVLLLCER